MRRICRSSLSLFPGLFPAFWCWFVWGWLPWAMGQEPLASVDPPWRYRLDPPSEGWEQDRFDDSDWPEGNGGFGNPTTPGSRVGTEWNTKEIWLRRTVDLPSIPNQPALYMHHDEDADVFINGKPALQRKGYTTEYKVFPIAADLLRTGSNAIAIHCRQTGGGQFIDAHIIDADRVPRLPKPKLAVAPFRSSLVTRWGKQVDASNVWQDYPRPQMERDQWTRLNGDWDYAIRPRSEENAALDPMPHDWDWDGKILVPFCLESKLGGVQRKLMDDEVLWYHRTFEHSPRGDFRTLIHFEAVDYRCHVFVNGKHVGSHVGGNTAFSVDATPALTSGVNHLAVRVEDDTEGSQLRGKQVRFPGGIWYTQVSGIWQTVWMETVPSFFIDDLSIATDARQGSVTVRLAVSGGPVDASRQQMNRWRVTLYDGDQSSHAAVEAVSNPITLRVPNPKLWSPSSPHLYPLAIELMDPNDRVIDTVRSYAGIRTFGKMRDADGHLRLTLNGQEIFHFGTLDQGWWPDGLLTPPSDEAMLYDIEFLKSAGFNMIRKHIKVEPRRYYYHCDRLGMLLWQDQVSGGPFANWTRMAPDPKDAIWSDPDHAQYMKEFDAMVRQLANVTSIAVWTPFNEAWGQHRTMEVGQWIADRDPTRAVNIASGGNFWAVGDIADEHNYPDPSFPLDAARFSDFVKVVGEFGGHGWLVPGHLWDNNKENWGYGGLPASEQEYRDRYRKSIRILAELKRQGIAAGVYTQTTDVEGEVNGLMTYDREVAKISPSELRQIHSMLNANP